MSNINHGFPCINKNNLHIHHNNNCEIQKILKVRLTIKFYLFIFLRVSYACHCTNVSTQIERHPLSERHPVFWVLHTMWLWHRKQRLEATGPTKGYKINHLLDNSQCPNFFNPFLLSN